MKYKGYYIDYIPDLPGYNACHEDNDGEGGLEASSIEELKKMIDEEVEYQLFEEQFLKASNDLYALTLKWQDEDIMMAPSVEAGLKLFIDAGLSISHSKEVFLDRVHEIIESCEKKEGDWGTL